MPVGIPRINLARDRNAAASVRSQQFSATLIPTRVHSLSVRLQLRGTRMGVSISSEPMMATTATILATPRRGWAKDRHCRVAPPRPCLCGPSAQLGARDIK